MNTTAAEANWLLLGFSINELLLAGFAILIGVAGRFLFAHWAKDGIAWLTAKTEGDLDDRIGEAVAQPLTILPIAVGVFFATQALNLSGLAAGVGESVAQTLLSVTVFWALLRLVDPLFEAFASLREMLSPSMRDWLKRAARAMVWLIGGATILELWGIRVLPIIAGLGLLGVAVALGAQDLFKNLISGLLILGESRFCKGHWVKVDGVVEGTVEEIGFRSTKIRQFDRAPVYVPNAAFADAAVVNYGEMTNRRISWTIGLEYRTSAEQLSTIRDRVEQAIAEDERFLPVGEAPQLVRLDMFADSSINLMVYCFTRTRDWAEWLAIKEELLLTVKRIVEEEGAGFAFPSTSIYLEQTPALDSAGGLGGGSPSSPKPGAKRATRSTAKSGSSKSTAKGQAKSASKNSAATDSSPTIDDSSEPGPANDGEASYKEAPRSESAPSQSALADA